jgi:broad specificity phosphatase PhoE
MIRKQEIKNPQIIIYTSPFQRCIDTSIGIARGIEKFKINTTPKLRMDIGLGEWMCERFFDTICPAQHLISKQQEKLARQQAYSYSILAKKNQQSENNNTILPPLFIDYGYNNSNINEFDYPERYTDMIHRFEETRINCLNQHNEQQTVLIFVTHAVGVNALLDGFRNRVTIPLESNYCSISCVRHGNNTSKNSLIDATSDQSDQEEEEEDCEYLDNSSPTKLKWFIDTVMYDKHLLL